MFAPSQAWHPTISWTSPAGKTLRTLVDEIKRSSLANSPISITVFGSAPLQLGVDEGFLSADVDIFCNTDLRNLIQSAGLGRGQNPIYVEQNDEIVFAASSSWRERAHSESFGQVTVTFPHPIDILVSKIARLEPKDLAAFRLVLQRTGHPTAPELIEALQRVVDVFRPNFDEENSGDPLTNTRTIWRELYDSEIDVRREIILPALARRRENYGLPAPHRAHLRELTDN